MTIVAKQSLLHWNYYLALEDDLHEAARYIEFSEANFSTYSIELAHLLLASASEVDVVAQGLCQHLDPNAHPRAIDAYRPIITAGIPSLATEVVYVPRFGLTLTPWSNWDEGDRSPLWWRSYNAVKHHRDEHFADANLKNALNSMAALLLTVFHHYRLEHGHDTTRRGLKDATRLLTPESRLLRLPEDYYPSHLLLE